MQAYLRKAKAYRYQCKYKEALAALDQALGMEGVEDDYVKSVKLEMQEEQKNELNQIILVQKIVIQMVF